MAWEIRVYSIPRDPDDEWVPPTNEICPVCQQKLLEDQKVWKWPDGHGRHFACVNYDEWNAAWKKHGKQQMTGGDE